MHEKSNPLHLIKKGKLHLHMNERMLNRSFLLECIDLITSIQEISLPGNNLSVGETLQKLLHIAKPLRRNRRLFVFKTNQN